MKTIDNNLEPYVKRYPQNPILTPADVPYMVATVHNAGVVKVNGEYIMIFRSHLHNGRSILGKAVSTDGYNFVVSEEPFMIPSEKDDARIYEEFGVEDPRITKIDDEFYITYSAYSRYGVRIGLARTRDFQKVERVSFITTPDHRNVVLFPEKFNDRYVRLERPHTNIHKWSIWISYSYDLIHWGDSQILIRPEDYHWDEMKIGPGAPPIKTSNGWLNIFHGVFQTMSGSVYRLGVALHSLEDPSRILGVSDKWILQPEEQYERVGYVPNVVFTCGAILEDDGTIKIYYGAADTVMCLGTAKSTTLIDLCLNSSRNAL
jgi:predicted GH43/DUF377 family glycosyl hydrolase